MDTVSDSAEPTGPAGPLSEPQPTQPPPAEPANLAADGGLGPRERLIVWLTTSACAAVGLAWIAVQLQTGGFAPVGLMPILMGIAVAASIEGLARLTEIGPARSWLAVACLGGCLTVAAENYVAYYRYQSAYEALLQSNPKMELFRGDERSGPAGFGRFMKIRLAELPVLWTADAALTIAAATGWTFFRLRLTSAGRQLARQTEEKG